MKDRCKVSGGRGGGEGGGWRGAEAGGLFWGKMRERHARHPLHCWTGHDFGDYCQEVYIMPGHQCADLHAHGCTGQLCLCSALLFAKMQKFTTSLT